MSGLGLVCRVMSYIVGLMVLKSRDSGALRGFRELGFSVRVHWAFQFSEVRVFGFEGLGF